MKKSPPTLRSLLSADRSCRGANVLAGNFGDGYLYRHNHLYQNVRNQALASGFTFSLDDPFNYFCLPLMAMDKVLKKKLIPYLNNSAAIADFDKTRPGWFTSDNLNCIAPRGNKLAHEATHGVAHLTWRRIFSGVKESRRQTVLRVLLGESFANSIDLLSNLYNDGPLHSYFLQMNSFLFYQPAKIEPLKVLRDELGLRNLLRLTAVYYLYSNFLYAELSTKEERKIISLLEIQVPKLNSRRWVSAVRGLRELAFNLSLDFRTETTQIYFHSRGFRTSIYSIVNFSPIEQLQRYPANLEFINQMAGQLAGI